MASARFGASRRPPSCPVGHNAWFIDRPIRLLPRPLAPLPNSITPLPIVQEIIDQVDLTRLMFNTNELSGQQATTINGQPYTITTRNTLSGTPVNQSVAYMVERLQRLGLAVTTHTWNASRPPNVIAEKPGLNPSAGIVIICAHLDDMPSSGLAPGADDNGSGSIAVLHAAEILAPYNFDATLRFILFTGEEQGLLGSAAYANMVQSQDIRGVLNMDMIAWDNSGRAQHGSACQQFGGRQRGPGAGFRRRGECVRSDLDAGSLLQRHRRQRPRLVLERRYSCLLGDRKLQCGCRCAASTSTPTTTPRAIVRSISTRLSSPI